MPRGQKSKSSTTTINGGRITSPLFPTTTFPPSITPTLPPTTSTSLSLSLSKQKMAKKINFVGAVLCLAVVGIMGAGGETSIAEKCAPQFQKVAQCLSFVTAKAAAPSKECCESVTELKDSDPACLCYIIQQVHNGSNAAVKRMGLQETRLLQLPSACKLANASVTECPKLLNLPPNSPDASIFTNTSTTTTTPVATPGTSSSTTASSKGEWHKPQVAGCLMVAMAIFFHAFFIMPPCF